MLKGLSQMFQSMRDALEEDIKEHERQPYVFINPEVLRRERRQKLVEMAPPAPSHRDMMWVPEVDPAASNLDKAVARQLAWAEAWADAIMQRYP